MKNQRYVEIILRFFRTIILIDAKLFVSVVMIPCFF